jgi:hypothetical protein
MHYPPDDPELTLDTETSACPGCEVGLPAHDGPTHRYLHLMTLCVVLEKGADPLDAPDFTNAWSRDRLSTGSNRRAPTGT